jgi:choline monooxygenase
MSLTAEAPLSLGQRLEALRRPATEADTMPPEAYWSPELYEREVDHIFNAQWICVGRADEIPSIGDYFTQNIAGESVIVVRDGDNQIRAHINVCRHRGCQVVEGAGTTNAFRCPYHGWLYGLNGSLRGVPDFQDTKNFDKSRYSLHAAQAEVWDGFIMVNFDPAARPYREQVSQTARWGLDKYHLADHRTTHRWVWKLACNWKAYVENFIEEYHIPWVHAETFQPVTPMKGWVEFPELTDQPWGVMIGQFPGFTLSDTGDALFPVTADLTNVDTAYHGMPIWLGYPCFGIVPMVDSALYFLMLPDGPEQMELHVRLCLHKDAAEAFAAGEPDAVKAAEEYACNTEYVVLEDNRICEAQQRGIRSRHAVPGRYSRHEGLAWEFDRWVAETAYVASGNGAA